MDRSYRKIFRRSALATLPMIAFAAAVFLVIKFGGFDRDASAENGAEEAESEKSVPKGQHGGRMLSEGEFALEITIYERGVPPQFRVFPFSGKDSIDPADVELFVELRRLGGKMDKFNFVKEGDYLKGDGVVSEPHSFDVIVSAKWKGRIYNWEYEQFEGRVRMTDEVVNGAGIDVAVAGPVSMDLSVELPGRVVLNSDMVAHVVSGLSGVVTEVRKNLGDTVNKGDVLVVLESRDLSELKGGFLIAVKKLELAVESFKREEILREKKISAEQDYLASKMELARAEIEEMAASMKLAAVGLSPGEIKKLRKGNAGSLARYEIRAPFDGTVIEKSVSLGEALSDNSDIYVIADLSSVWVEVPVHRNEMASAVLGKDVVVRSKFLNKEAKGKITYVSPLAGEKIQTATARVVLDNAGGEWRPGLYVDVILMKESIEAPVAVPVEAIQSFRDWTVVFVRYDDVFEMHPVELGRGDGRWVEILDGLSSGEKYAVKNSFVLKAEIGKAGATHDH